MRKMILVLCLFLLVLGITPLGFADAPSAALGANVTYWIGGDGVADIYGSGPMYDYQSGNSPLYYYKTDITAIQIQHGITRIGNHAFSHLDYVTSITIPSSVESISEFAFAYLKMKSLYIPEGVKRIENHAFFYAELESITLPSSIESGINIIGAFEGCLSLKDVYYLGTKAQMQASRMNFIRENLNSDLFPTNVTVHYMGEPRGFFTDEQGYTYYYDDNGEKITEDWLQINGAWYYFMRDGRMATGTRIINGVKYVFGSDGVWQGSDQKETKQSGWVQEGYNWIYYRNGAKITGWSLISGIWYHFSSSGTMTTGWFQDGGNWYYCFSTGAMATGWLSLGESWYYCLDSGIMATGWQEIDGRWEMFSDDGQWLYTWAGN